MAGLEGIAQLMEADDFRRRLDMYERQNEARRNFETSLKPKLQANIKSKKLSKAKKNKLLNMLLRV